MTTLDLDLDSAVELAHALVGEVSRKSRVRALVLKGPIAAIYDLRDRRSSADVDVLVSSEDLEVFCELLVRRGWHAPVHRDQPRFLAEHSVTLTHDRWPCAIDVHHYFPGFFAKSEVVFDRLWETRSEFRIASTRLTAPSRAGMAMILALHVLRAPHEQRNQSELARLIKSMRDGFDTAERAEFLAIARVGRAQWTTSTVLDELGWPWLDDATAAEKEIWLANQADGPEKSAELWERELKGAVRRFRFRQVIKVFWVSRKDMPRRLEYELPSWREFWDYQWHRWARGIEAFRASRDRRN